MTPAARPWRAAGLNPLPACSPTKVLSSTLCGSSCPRASWGAAFGRGPPGWDAALRGGYQGGPKVRCLGGCVPLAGCSPRWARAKFGRRTCAREALLAIGLCALILKRSTCGAMQIQGASCQALRQGLKGLVSCWTLPSSHSLQLERFFLLASGWVLRARCTMLPWQVATPCVWGGSVAVTFPLPASPSPQSSDPPSTPLLPAPAFDRRPPFHHHSSHIACACRCRAPA